MSYQKFRLFCTSGLAGAGLVLLAVPSAHAQCAAFSHEVGVALCRSVLSDAELSHLRGGFELAPGVKAFFAFSQIIKVDGQTVQSIIVPQMEISAANPTANFTVSGIDTTKVLSGSTTVPLQSSGTGLQSAVITTSPLSGDLSVVTGVNNGATQVSAQLTSRGLTSQIANTANGAAVSAATTIDLATQGLPAFIQSQRTAGMIFNNLQQSQVMPH